MSQLGSWGPDPALEEHKAQVSALQREVAQLQNALNEAQWELQRRGAQVGNRWALACCAPVCV